MYVCLGWVQGELSSRNLDSNLLFLHVNFHEDVLIKKYKYSSNIFFLAPWLRFELYSTV